MSPSPSDEIRLKINNQILPHSKASPQRRTNGTHASYMDLIFWPTYISENPSTPLSRLSRQYEFMYNLLASIQPYFSTLPVGTPDT